MGHAQLARDLKVDAVHVDRLGRNAFVVTMIGSVAFVITCAWVLST